MIAEVYSKPVLIFGCGNTLFGDDGFGPAVIEHLTAHHQLPGHVLAADVGTSIRELLFDLLLAPQKPRRIMVIDAADQPQRRPGELFEMNIDEIAPQKVNDFSLHQFPSLNMLEELNSVEGLTVKVLAVQAKQIPDSVRPGLSPEVEAALPEACSWIIQQIEEAS
jgi:coenzyme F420 hydrogenase subunit delta